MPAYRKNCLHAVATRGKLTPDAAQDYILTAGGMVGNHSLKLTGRGISALLGGTREHVSR
jgi:hypothetical protein